MSEEQKKEICKASFYGLSVEKIMEIEEIPESAVVDALEWGAETGYFDELKGRAEG